MADDETLRLLLQNKFDRVESLVQMNHAATLAVPSVLAAIWGISLEKCRYDMIPVLCVISIGLLLLWRYFAHYLDYDIVNHYSKIIDIEKELHVPKHLSISKGIIDGICKDITPIQNQELGSDLSALCDPQSKQFVKLLILLKRIGYRGHEKWDMLALFGISFFSFILFKPLILTIESDVFHLTDIYIFIGFFLAFLIIGLILPCIFFIKIENFIWNFFKFQIMYDDENLKNAIKEAQKIGTNME